ncbi:MAG: 30S ribosomal protein S4 [Nitrososphaerales archaeon]
MGDPKKQRKSFKRPRLTWSTDQLMQELETVGTFGLRNKRELWKVQSELSRIRKGARALLALPTEVRHAKETELLGSLIRLGLVAEGATLDDVLNLKTEDLLERRLQSIVMRKKFAKTPNQARQMVVHGHIVINDRVINIPGYMVRVDEEKNVIVRPDSPHVGMISAPPAPEAGEGAGKSAEEKKPA